MPDVLIVDYNLPGLTGIEFYEKIKRTLQGGKSNHAQRSWTMAIWSKVLYKKGVRDYVIRMKTY